MSSLLTPTSGNARIAGMGTDLHLVGLKYNIAAAVFFVCFCNRYVAGFCLWTFLHRSPTVSQKYLREFIYIIQTYSDLSVSAFI